MRNYVEDAPQTAQPIPISLSLPQQTLLELLNIDETAVRLNRAGKLTTDQANFVRGQMKHDDDGTWLLATIFIGTSLLLSLIFLMQGLSMAYLLVGLFIFLGSFAAYVMRKRSKRSRDLDTRVGKVKGDLRIIASERLAQWAMVIGDRMFPISQALAEKFNGYELPVVAAYYTLGTNTLLSMEVLAHEKRKNDELTAEDDEDDEIEQPLASWDKPKNTLAVDDTPDDSREAESQPETAEKEQASTSKRRF
jgi:hypothetical protein